MRRVPGRGYFGFGLKRSEKTGTHKVGFEVSHPILCWGFLEVLESKFCFRFIEILCIVFPGVGLTDIHP